MKYIVNFLAFRRWFYFATTRKKVFGLLFSGASLVCADAMAIPVNLSDLYSETPAIALGDREGADIFSATNGMLAAGEFDAVIAMAEKAIAENQNLGIAQEILGTALMLSGQLESAVEPLTRAGQLEPDLQDAIAKIGIIRMQQGSIDEAKELFELALSRDGEDRYVHQRLGLIYEFENDYPLAAKHFYQGLVGTDAQYLGVAVNLANVLNRMNRNLEAVAVLEPRLPLSISDPSEAQIILATAFLGAGDHAKARERFERYLELQPESVEAKLGVAKSMAAQGEHATAVAQMQLLIEEDANWPVVWVEIGKVYLLASEPEKAIAAFDRAKQLGIESVELERRLARYYVSEGDLNRATEILETLIETSDANPATYSDYSEILLSQDQASLSEEILRKGLERFSDNAYLHLRLGAFLASLGRYDDALPEIKRSVTIAPNDPSSLRAYSLLQTRLGDLEGAAQTAGRLYEVAQTRSEAAVFYGIQLDVAGKKSQAEKMYRIGIDADPANLVAINNMANLLSQANRIEEASVFAQRAMDLAPQNPQIMDTYGWVLYLQGDYAEAAKLLEKSALGMSKSAVIHYHYGMALAKLDDRKAAEIALRNALEIEPDASWANDAKAQLQQL